MVKILFKTDQGEKVVFIRVPKTGSTSIINGVFHGINNAKEFYDGDDLPKEWMQYFKFSFIRDPVERFLSAFTMFKNYPVESDKEKKFRENLNIQSIFEVLNDKNIKLIGDGYLSKLKIHLLPYSHPYFQLDKMNYIGRFNSFQKEYMFLCHKLKNNCADIPLDRKSNRIKFKSIFSYSDFQDFTSYYSGDFQMYYGVQKPVWMSFIRNYIRD